METIPSPQAYIRILIHNKVPSCLRTLARTGWTMGVEKLHR